MKTGVIAKWWNREKTEVRQFIFCLVGVLLYKCLDIANEALNFSAVSITFIGFAVAIALIITVAVDNDPIPKDSTPETRTKILRRISKNAVLMGFFWQTVLSKLQDAIQI
jgi:hypothetical protein